MLSARRRAGRGSSKRRVPTTQPSAQPFESSPSTSRSPENAEAAVDVEEIQARVRHLKVTDGRGSSSPRSRQKGSATRRKLFDSKSAGEDHALVKFVLLHSDGSSRKDDAAFWESAGVFVQGLANSTHCRTGLSTHKIGM